MSILDNKKGALKSFNLSITHREVALGSSSLPNSEGATNQVSFTIQQSDLPTITPSPYDNKYLACITTSGYIGASTNTIFYRAFKNSSSLYVGSGNAIGANAVWSQNHWRFYDVKVGDVLDVRTWASTLDVTIDYACLTVYPANIFFSKPPVVMQDIVLTNATTTQSPNPTGAGVRGATVVNSGSYVLSPVITNQGFWFSLGFVNGTIGYFQPNPIVGFIRMGYGGDTNLSVTQQYSNPTQIQFQKNIFPGIVSYRELPNIISS